MFFVKFHNPQPTVSFRRLSNSNRDDGQFTAFRGSSANLLGDNKAQPSVEDVCPLRGN